MQIIRNGMVWNELLPVISVIMTACYNINLRGRTLLNFRGENETITTEFT